MWMTVNTMAKRKRANNGWHNTTQKTKEIQNETISNGVELKCRGKVSGSCSTSGTPRTTFDMLWVVVCDHFQKTCSESISDLLLYVWQENIGSSHCHFCS